MGRYSTDVVSSMPLSNQQSPSKGQQYWPSIFPNAMVSLDLNGTIIEDRLLTSPQNVVVIPGVLDAIRTIRIKGHPLFVLSDQPDITRGKIYPDNIETAFQHLMDVFGQAGIQTIDGFLYNTSDIKNDEFAKPNVGMIRRAENEILQGSTKFKGGYHVGDSIGDLKMAIKASMTPVLVLTGSGRNALKELDKHANKELKKKTRVVDNLQQFADSL